MRTISYHKERLLTFMAIAEVMAKDARFNGEIHRLPTGHATFMGTSKNSDFVIPAKAGIQCFQSTGHRPSPVRQIFRGSFLAYTVSCQNGYESMESKIVFAGRMRPWAVIRRMATHAADNAMLIHPTEDRLGKQPDRQGSFIPNGDSLYSRAMNTTVAPNGEFTQVLA